MLRPCLPARGSGRGHSSLVLRALPAGLLPTPRGEGLVSGDGQRWVTVGCRNQHSSHQDYDFLLEGKRTFWNPRTPFPLAGFCSFRLLLALTQGPSSQGGITSHVLNDPQASSGHGPCIFTLRQAGGLAET